MSEQEKILKAAKKFAEDNGERITNVKEYLTRNDLQNSFTDGASFYAKEVMPGMMEKFSEWLRTFEALERPIAMSLQILTDTLSHNTITVNKC